MSDKIQLGVDVDTRTVRTAAKDTADLTKRVGALEDEYRQLGKEAGRAATELGKQTRATQQSERAINRASKEMQGLQGSMRSVAGLGSAVRTAITGFVGATIIRGLIDTAQQMDRINMTLTAVTGSSDAAAQEFAYVTDTANRLGQSVQVAAGAYAKMLAASQAAGISLQDSRNVFEGLSAAATTFGLTQYELEGALNAVQQMISKGTVQAEELRGQLGERLPGAFAIAAEAMGMTTAELNKALEQGKVSATAFVQAFGPELQKRFSGMATDSDTVTKRLNLLSNAFLDLKVAIIESGFLDALTTVLTALTALTKSDPVVAAVKAIGGAFKLMADNVVLASAAMAGMAVAFGWVSPAVAGITAVIASLGYLSTKTVEVEGQIISFGDISGRAFSILREEATTAFYDATRAAREWAADHPGLVDFVAKAFDLLHTALKSVVAGYAGMQAATWAILQQMFENAKAAVSNIAKIFSNFGELVRTVMTTPIMELGNLDWSDLLNLTEGTQALKDAGAAGGDAYNNAFAEEMAKPVFVRTGGGVLGAVQKATQELAEEMKASSVEAEKLGRLQKQRLEATKALVPVETAVTTELGKGAKAAGKAAKATDDIVKNGKQMVEDARKLADLWGGVDQSISDAMKGIATGQHVDAGNILTGFTDALFGPELQQQFDDLAKTLRNSITDALGGLGKTGLSGPALAGVGAGIGAAASGVMQGDTSMIGSGIGAAAGSVLGTQFLGMLGAAGGPIGMILGSIAGGFISKMFGGDSSWKSADVTAFAGTTYERDTSVRFNTKNEGATPVARAAMVATMALLEDFNVELREYVENLGGTVKAGTRLVVNQQAALKAITGYMNDFDAPRSGNAEQVAEQISAKVAEIMGIAASIAAKAGPALTEAQRLWRETQDKFSEENMAILRELGFSAKQMAKAQADIRVELARGFNKEMLDTLVDTGQASREELAKWKAAEFRNLDERRKQAMATAREIGANVDLVQSSFSAQRKDIVTEWRDMMEEITGTTVKAAEVIYTSMDRVNFRLNAVSQTISAGLVTPEIAQMQKFDALKVLEDQRDAMMRQARQMGFANTEFVTTWFRASTAKINRDFRALIASLAEVTDGVAKVAVTFLDKVEFRLNAVSQTISAGLVTPEIAQMQRFDQMRVLEEQRDAMMRQARQMGFANTEFVTTWFRASRARINRDFRALIDGLVEITDGVAKVSVTFLDKVKFRLDAVSQTISAGLVTPEIAQMQRFDAMRVLEEQRDAMLRQAREMGFANTDFVTHWFRASRAKINRDFRDLIDGLSETVEKKVLVVSSRQQSIIQQAEQMAEGLRNAARSIADVQASLMIGQQSPLGLQDQLSEARRQFAVAVRKTRGGDLGAAGEVGGLAQTVLQLGQQVYGSSGNYANMFNAIQSTLTSLGVNLTTKAKTLETKLQEDILKGQTKQTDITEAGFVELARKLDAVITQLEKQDKNNRIANAKRSVA